MPSSDKIIELRYTSSTTFPTGFTDANDSSWDAGTAVKIRMVEDPEIGLTWDSEPDTTRQQRIDAHPARIPTLRRGTFGFKTYLGSGDGSTTTANMLATLLSKFFGGLQTPSAKTDTLDSAGTHTTSVIYATSHGAAAGEYVLVGTKGDSRGEGEVRRILSVTTDSMTLSMNLSAAPNDGDAIVFGHVVYLDPDATQEYLSLLLIGQESEKQYNIVGCMGSPTFEALDVGQLPMVNFNIDHIASWRKEASGTRESLSTTTASDGRDPPAERGLGALFLADASGSAVSRSVFQHGQVTINPNITFSELPGRHGLNGVAGYVRVPSDEGVKASFQVIAGQDTGFLDDFSTPTAKQAIYQIGAEAGACVAFGIQRMFIDGKPEDTAINGLSGYTLDCHATEGTSLTTDLLGTALAVAFF